MQKDLEQGDRMRLRCDQLMMEDQYAVDSMRPKCVELQRMCEQYKELLRRRRQMLTRSHDLHDRLERVSDLQKKLFITQLCFMCMQQLDLTYRSPVTLVLLEWGEWVKTTALMYKEDDEIRNEPNIKMSIISIIMNSIIIAACPYTNICGGHLRVCFYARNVSLSVSLRLLLFNYSPPHSSQPYKESAQVE